MHSAQCTVHQTVQWTVQYSASQCTVNSTVQCTVQYIVQCTVQYTTEHSVVQCTVQYWPVGIYCYSAAAGGRELPGGDRVDKNGNWCFKKMCPARCTEDSIPKFKVISRILSNQSSMCYLSNKCRSSLQPFLLCQNHLFCDFSVACEDSWPPGWRSVVWVSKPPAGDEHFSHFAMYCRVLYGRFYFF